MGMEGDLEAPSLCEAEYYRSESEDLFMEVREGGYPSFRIRRRDLY